MCTLNRHFFWAKTNHQLKQALSKFVDIGNKGVGHVVLQGRARDVFKEP